MPSARDIAFIGCRLLALYILWGVLQYSAFNVPFLLQALSQPEASRAGQLADVSGYVAAMLVSLAISPILWFGADWIAGKVAAGTTEGQGETSRPWPRERALSVAVAVLGLWILIEYLPNLASEVALAVRDGFAHTPALVSAALTTALGLICVLGSRGIVEFVKQLRGGMAKLSRWLVERRGV